jgi:serine/threonine protein kinase
MNWLREPDAEPIPGYRLLEPLGTGGFGEVWKCIAPGGIHKAIKFVYGNMNSLDGDAAKAEQEFKALERVKAVRHPFVLPMDRIEVVNGELLIVMELADKSLHDCVLEYQDAGRPGIPRDILLGFLADAAEGLDHLIEKHNLQHLDVKPKNLFLIADRVKVADFGLVKHLERQSGSGLMGGVTPVYAAPETFANKISKHSDQYSLAVVYCELLTGQRPFSGKNIRQLALQHMTEAPDLRMLPDADRAVVAKALAKNPDERFPNCTAFVRSLAGGSLLTEAASSKTLADIRSTTRMRSSPSLDFDFSSIGSTPPPTDVVSSGVTVSRLEVGVLRPAILIGVGSFGRRAIQQIRCRLLDRVGDLGQVPSFRFLYVDADPYAVEKAIRGSPEVALQADQVLHLPLQPVTGYRRKQLDQVLEWLPREKLYGIPRSLGVEGSRALGRLAFCDHYLRVAQRLRHEIQIATHPEAIKQSADQAGLAVRGKVPNVYVFASATGGSGGMLLDLGHAIRKALAKFNMPDAPVTAFVFAGAPEDVLSPPGELANIFAALTELHHYADPDVTFSARYGGPEGPKVEAAGLPFTATYLLPMSQRSGEGFRDCLSHLSGYVSHELTTPLGGGLEDVRRVPPPHGRTPFRGFGTFGVWFPRGLLLRSAARQTCIEVFRQWAAATDGGPPAEANAVAEAVLADQRLTADSVQTFIVNESARGPDGNPVEAAWKWVRGVAEQADAIARRSDGANWAIAAWDQAKELIGFEPTTEADSGYRRGRLSKSLDSGVRTAQSAWENEFSELFRPLVEMIGPRLAATEEALKNVVAALASAAATQDDQLARLQKDRLEARLAVQSALEACQAGSGGFSLFGGRTNRQLRGFADRLARFVELRVKEDLATVAGVFYRRMQGVLLDRMRDTTIARERLGQLVQLMNAPILLSDGAREPTGDGDPSESSDEAMQTTLQMANTVRVVLPNGEDHLDRSAKDMLNGMTPDQYRQLQSVLQRLVLEPRGGLAKICALSPDLPKGLAVPAIEQATAYLSTLLPAQDVTQVELSTREVKEGGLQRRIASYIKLAAPPAAGPPEEERTYVLVPATEAGMKFAREVKQVIPKAVAVTVQGTGTDLLFCREQGALRGSDLMKLIEPCWEAYAAAVAVPEKNPHSRFDVTEWLPIVAR